MGERISIKYDEIGSLLFLEVCEPYANQDSNEIGESLVARSNPSTGDLESLEVLFFDSWLKKEKEIHIPVSVELRFAGSFLTRATGETLSTVPSLIFKYDFERDTLFMLQPNAYPNRGRVEISEGAIANINPATGAIEGLEIHSFKARSAKDGEITLPIEATFRLVGQPITAD